MSFNRYRNRRVRDLSARATSLRGQLLANEAAIVTIDQKTAEITAGALAEIEEYVDSLAQLFSADEKATSPLLQQDDAKLHERLVFWRWHGVETVEQAKDVLADEVAHRSVGKTDLALLLSSVDRTAFLLYGKMPEVFKSLHGEELIGEIVKSLDDEEFTKTLMADPQWAEMRRRWVRFGWRMTTEETFNAAFIRAAAERVVEIHDGKDDSAVRGGFAVDTILDEVIQKERQAVRDQMIEAFRLRLEREYDALPRRGDRSAEIQVPLDASEAKLLDAVADRWDTSRSGALERIVREATVDALRRDHPGLTINQLPKETINEPYSDHALMRRGRDVWDQSYANGMTDEQLRDGIGALNTVGPFDDEMTLFAAKWAVHAFQRLMTSHTFAAALMCSDVQREVLTGIERQWDAFLVIVPNGMLFASEFEISRVMVATYSFGARLTLLTTGGPNVPVRMTGTIGDEKPTLADLLVSEGDDLHEDQVTRRCLVMAKRLVAGLLLNLQHEPNFKVKEVEARPKSKKREMEPEHRIVTIGAPIEIDCRDAVKEYIEHGKAGRKHGPPTVQVMVRGHYRRQVCGIGRMERKVIWISPFWRGPEAALIQTRASKVSS